MSPEEHRMAFSEDGLLGGNCPVAVCVHQNRREKGGARLHPQAEGTGCRPDPSAEGTWRASSIVLGPAEPEPRQACHLATGSMCGGDSRPAVASRFCHIPATFERALPRLPNSTGGQGAGLPQDRPWGALRRAGTRGAEDTRGSGWGPSPPPPGHLCVQRAPGSAPIQGWNSAHDSGKSQAPPPLPPPETLVCLPSPATYGPGGGPSGPASSAPSVLLASLAG